MIKAAGHNASSTKSKGSTAVKKNKTSVNYRKDKKPKINERKRTPKTIAQKHQLTETRTFEFIRKRYGFFLDIFCILLIVFSGVVIYCLVSPNDREASVFCNNLSETLFGTAGIVFFIGLALICVRVMMRNIGRFSHIPWKTIGFFTGLYWYAMVFIQHFFNRMNPFGDPRNGAGAIANFLDQLLMKVFGDTGIMIVLVILGLLIFWFAWRFCARIYDQMIDTKSHIPVKTYWNDAFSIEKEKKKEPKEESILPEEPILPLHMDITTDFSEASGQDSGQQDQETIKHRVRNAANSVKNTIDELSAKAKKPPVKEEKKKLTKPSEPKVEPVHIRSNQVTLVEPEERVDVKKTDVIFTPRLQTKQTQQVVPIDNWILPDIDLILDPKKVTTGQSPDDPTIQLQADKIEKVLRDYMAPGKVVDIQCGPTFTQFGVEPGFTVKNGRKTRIRISKIESIRKDIEMKLSTKQLTIEAPIPGKTYVGIQVQNKVRTSVSLREAIESDAFTKKRCELELALGKDINGRVYTADLTRMPHLLIAGMTGSGKSVCLNAILACLLLHNTPDQLKLILIDPKRVELTGYNGIPHLITPVVTDLDQVGNVLQWVIREMDKRNLHFMQNGVRNIQDFNARFPEQHMPYIVVVIDELANLMMEAASDVETSIIRLAQTARAMGIHLIVATQRPSREVVTGTIKGNLPTRIAFAVASYVDSQVILDRPGAENLFGRGDMYFLSAEETKMRRLQCVYVSDEEIRRLVKYWAAKPKKSTAEVPEDANKPTMTTERVFPPIEPSDGLLTQLPLFNEPAPPMKNDGDPLYDEAVKMVQRRGKASGNMLVSKLGIGFGRANKLLARMEDEGIISPPNENPAIPREVLIPGEYGTEADAD